MVAERERLSLLQTQLNRMAESKSVSFFKSPPQMREGLSYVEWKKELEIWCDFTDLPTEKLGGALFLTLTGKARQAVLAEVPRKDIICRRNKVHHQLFR